MIAEAKPEVGRAIGLGERRSIFTSQQIEVLQGMADGLTTEEIAASLGISHHAVDSRRDGITHRIYLTEEEELPPYESGYRAVYRAVSEGSVNVDNLPDISEVSLTPRELQIFALIAIGYNNSRIAKTLGYRNGAIGNRVTALYEKLGTTNRYVVIALGVRELQNASGV
jgi:DNA-binding NarL/FixJ family response regulator